MIPVYTSQISMDCLDKLDSKWYLSKFFLKMHIQILCMPEHSKHSDFIDEVKVQYELCLCLQAEDGGLELVVTGLPPDVADRKIQSRLKKLSVNCGGRVVCVSKETAVLRFSCHNDAVKYVHVINHC
jgi:hypothetical protein